MDVECRDAVQRRALPVQGTDSETVIETTPSTPTECISPGGLPRGTCTGGSSPGPIVAAPTRCFQINKTDPDRISECGNAILPHVAVQSQDSTVMEKLHCSNAWCAKDINTPGKTIAGGARNLHCCCSTHNEVTSIIVVQLPQGKMSHLSMFRRLLTKQDLCLFLVVSLLLLIVN